MTTVEVAGDYRWVKLSTGLNHTCGLTTEGRALCWGSNVDGQLGTGSKGPLASVPNAIAGDFTFRALVVGDRHACGLTTDQELICWGDTGVLNVAPARVATTRRFRALAAGPDHTCGIEEGTGAVFCWSGNREGQAGQPPTSWNVRLPIQAVPTALRFQALTAGPNYTCGLTTNSTVACWGEARSGVLGAAAWGALAPNPDGQPVPTEVILRVVP